MIKGKGWFIWRIVACEGGSATAIASVAKSTGVSHVLIKVADGAYAVNLDQNTKKDLCPPVVSALHSKGISVWGWHYVYGYPVQEAQIAVKRCLDLGLDGYVVNAEVEFQADGMAEKARRFMSELRKGIPKLPVALSSFRFPSLHMQFPWKDFLDRCDINMPQVYWQGATNAGAQLRRCVREFQAMIPSRPIIPTGPVYRGGGWNASQAEIHEFLATAKDLNLTAANFFAWDYGRTNLLPLWDTVTAFNWSGSSFVDLPEKYIAAMNTRDANKVIALYADKAVHITAAQTLQGLEAIYNRYVTFLGQTLPGATFKLTGASGTGSSRHFTWTATSPKGKITNGNDTVGLVDGKITYHYSYFTITAP